MRKRSDQHQPQPTVALAGPQRSHLFGPQQEFFSRFVIPQLFSFAILNLLASFFTPPLVAFQAFCLLAMGLILVISVAARFWRLSYSRNLILFEEILLSASIVVQYLIIRGDFLLTVAVPSALLLSVHALLSTSRRELLFLSIPFVTGVFSALIFFPPTDPHFAAEVLIAALLNGAVIYYTFRRRGTHPALLGSELADSENELPKLFEDVDAASRLGGSWEIQQCELERFQLTRARLLLLLAIFASLGVVLIVLESQAHTPPFSLLCSLVGWSLFGLLFQSRRFIRYYSLQEVLLLGTLLLWGAMDTVLAHSAWPVTVLAVAIVFTCIGTTIALWFYLLLLFSTIILVVVLLLTPLWIPVSALLMLCSLVFLREYGLLRRWYILTRAIEETLTEEGGDGIQRLLAQMLLFLAQGHEGACISSTDGARVSRKSLLQVLPADLTQHLYVTLARKLGKRSSRFFPREEVRSELEGLPFHSDVWVFSARDFPVGPAPGGVYFLAADEFSWLSGPSRQFRALGELLLTRFTKHIRHTLSVDSTGRSMEGKERRIGQLEDHIRQLVHGVNNTCQEVLSILDESNVANEKITRAEQVLTEFAREVTDDKLLDELVTRTRAHGVGEISCMSVVQALRDLCYSPAIAQKVRIRGEESGAQGRYFTVRGKDFVVSALRGLARDLGRDASRLDIEFEFRTEPRPVFQCTMTADDAMERFALYKTLSRDSRLSGSERAGVLALALVRYFRQAPQSLDIEITPRQRLRISFPYYEYGPEKETLLPQRSVLFVDDSVAVIRFYESICRALRLRGLFAGSTKEALRLWESAAPSLIVTDLNLGNESALDFLVELQHRAGSLPPVIVVSGEIDSMIRERLVNLGITTILQKPFQKRVFFQHIETILQES